MRLINDDTVSAEESRQAFDNMITIFRSVYPEMSPELEAAIREQAVVASFKAGDIIVDYGEVGNYCLFTLTGVVRSAFVIDGREVPVWYSTPGHVVIALDSWYTGGKSEEQLMATKDVLCTAIEKADLENILNTFIEFNIPVRRLTELYLRESLRRTMWIYYDSYGKYRNLLKNYCGIARELTLAELARFMGMARETVSRLRNKRMR